MFFFKFICKDASPSIAVSPAVSTYNAAYGLSSSYISQPKVAISAPVLGKVIAAPAYSSGPAVASYTSGPAVSSYYSANKLAYSTTPSLSASYVSAPVKQISYAAPAVTQYTAPYTSGYASNYGSSYGISKLAYSAPPKVVSTYASPAISSSYLAANKLAYTGPNLAAQYAASYSPSISSSYISTPVTKQISYGTNPLLSGGYVSGYKSGGYIAPAIATSAAYGAGYVNTAGYQASSLGYFIFLFSSKF